MSTAATSTATVGGTETMFHGIKVTYDGGIGSYGTVAPEGGYEKLGVPMGTHLSLFRQHTDNPAEMAEILRSRIKRFQDGFGSLDDGQLASVTRTIQVYGQFVNQAGGNGDSQQ